MREMSGTTTPSSRFGWEGQTLEYTVRAAGANDLTVGGGCPDGVKVRILDTRPVGDGVEARVAVDVAKPVFY